MKTIAKLSPIALAVSALCISTGAIARDVNLEQFGNFNKEITKSLTDTAVINYANNADVAIKKYIEVNKVGNVTANLRVEGDIFVDSFTQALLDDKQINLNNWDMNTEVTNDAEIELNGNTGNIGANAAAGNYNQQKNEVAVAVSDGQSVFGWADAEAFTYQDYEFNTTENINVTNIADVRVDGGAGNIGANSAAGSGNQQSNALSVAVADAVLAEATGYIKQQNDNNNVMNDFVDNEAFITVANYNGNAGVNAAAGVGNQQANSVSVSVSRQGVSGNGIFQP